MVILIIVAALLIVAALIGRFFVNYALTFHTLDLNFTFEENSDAYKNSQINKEHTDQWLNSAKPERWNQTSFDGLNLIADFYPADSHKYVILVHGYTSGKEAMLVFGSYFKDWGYNVLAPDNRAHGESEGKWIGMGWLDSKDHLGWINKIVEKDPEAQITMLGVSMGGATVMMTSGLELPDNVKCLIEDCGYSCVWEEFCGQLKETFHLPPFPVLHISNIASKIIAGYSLKEASSLSRLKKAKLPMLFIHGQEDVFVPYSMLDENIAAYNGPEKVVLRMPEAIHGASLTFNTKLYLETVKTFVDKYIF